MVQYLQYLLIMISRWLRTSVLCHHRIPAIREKDNAGQTPAREHGAEGRGRGHSCVDAEVLHARAMGETERWGKGGCCAGEGDEWRGSDWNNGVRIREGVGIRQNQERTPREGRGAVIPEEYS